MRTNVIDHPLVTHKLTALRDRTTDSPTFRRLVDELVTLLAYEATRDVRVEPVTVENYLRGLSAACALAGHPIPSTLYERAAARRGWELRETSAIWHMRQSGLDDDAVIRELLAIQSDAIKMLSGNDDSTGTA
jgi:hypothetical protein